MRFFHDKYLNIFVFAVGITALTVAAISLMAGFLLPNNLKSPVALSLDKGSYEMGENIKIKLTNESTEMVCFSSCYPFYVESSGDRGWERYQYKSCEHEDQADFCLNGGEMKAFELIKPVDLIGKHRLTLPACISCNSQSLFRPNIWIYSGAFMVQ